MALAVRLNDNKYWVEDSDALPEAEKVQFAKDLLELERQRIFEYRDGTWGLADGVEVEETADGPVARFQIKKKERTNGESNLNPHSLHRVCSLRH